MARHVGEAKDEWLRHIDPPLGFFRLFHFCQNLLRSICISFRMDFTPFVIKCTPTASQKHDQSIQPLVIKLNREEGSNIKPLCIVSPSPFPYELNKAIHWVYDIQTFVSEDISNIAGVGSMTRSGRIYTPSTLQDKAPKEKEKTEEKGNESEEEIDELLKFIRQSEYSIVD
ncbi:hypothetical protein Fmac_018182 [Flemingia macrophylla]|uniref:Uncharacterized protein n=1 Tax=Flemingia macrophylla TaxID=520843 RepID=A0ABD1M4E9_9FABA